MSFKSAGLYPANPVTARGTATKISSHNDKVVYANGRSIIIRDLKNPSASASYTGHVQNTTVARFSPTGYYCASADVTGTVRVWDTVGEDQTLKGEYKVIPGRINDLAWDGESKRIIAVGEGRERFGHAFMMDSGSSTGEISGHSKTINAVSIRQRRPYRAATSGDDSSIVFFNGAPYKYEKTIKTHTKFVQDVRYSPSGDIFASVGSDSKVFVYDGKTGDTLAEIIDSPHKGSIMAASWSPDSKSLLTSAADRTVKLWDVETRKATTTWTVGSAVNDQQVGNTWSGESDLVSLSLSGDLNIFDPRSSDKPSRVFQAPQRSITTIAPSSSNTFLAGTADGRVLSYDTSSSESTTLGGEGHSNMVIGLAPSNDTIFSAGYDDRVREVAPGATDFTPASLSTASQPKAIAASDDGFVFVAEDGNIEVIKSNQKVTELKVSYTPSSVAVAGTSTVAIGADGKVHLYQWDGKALSETGVLDNNRAAVSALAFSPDGNMLAAGDSAGKVVLYDVKQKSMITGRWANHSARINSLSWTKDSKHCASGSLDTHVYVWSVAKPMKSIALKNVGPGGINGVLWVGESKLVSAGADGCVRAWDITFHA